MRRAGGLVLVAALAAGCSTGSIEDLPAATGGSPLTASARAVPVPVDQPPARGYAELVPGPPPGPPRQVPPHVPVTPLEYFRGLEFACSAAANLVTRGRGGLPRIEYDRYRDARVVRELSPGTVLIEDGRGTRLVLESWSSTGRVLPESGRPGDPLPEPYRTGCPTSTFGFAG